MYRMSNFYWPLRFLPHNVRGDTFALYHFCRAADDAVDNPQTSKMPALPLDIIERHHLPHHLFDEFLRGLMMDSDGLMVAPPLATLDLYCSRVAGCVGELLLNIWGEKSAIAPLYAQALGEALQLTNILRDINEDAARGRLYIPREWLEEEGFPPTLAALDAPLHTLCLRLGERAEDCFAKADALHSELISSVQLPTRWIASIYRTLLQKLLAAPLPATHKPRISLYSHARIAVGVLRAA